MIEFENRDITTVTKGIVAHGVNCQGVMGSGVALYIKNKWPKAFERYVELGSGEQLLSTTQIVPVDQDLYVANCFTQVSFGNDRDVRYADVEAVQKCLSDVFRYASMVDAPIYLPKIASDRGGLSWEDEVYPIIETLNNEYNNELSVTICVFEG